jgi:hypothetical protein
MGKGVGLDDEGEHKGQVQSATYPVCRLVGPEFSFSLELFCGPWDYLFTRRKHGREFLRGKPIGRDMNHDSGPHADYSTNLVTYGTFHVAVIFVSCF